VNTRTNIAINAKQNNHKKHIRRRQKQVRKINQSSAQKNSLRERKKAKITFAHMMVHERSQKEIS